MKSGDSVLRAQRRQALQFRRRFDGVIAADPARAAALLEERCDDLFAQGEAKVFAACVHRIPAPVRVIHPRTSLALVWRLTAQWRFEQAADLLDAVRTRIIEIERTHSRDEATELHLLVRHREAMFAQCQDDMPRADVLCRELIEDFRTASPYVKGSLFTALLHATREQYKCGELDRSDALARDCIEQSANSHALAVHEAVAGLSLFMAGRCDAAIAALRAGLDTAVMIAGSGDAMGALTAMPLAEVLYEQNSLEEAAELIAEYLPVVEEFGFVDQLISGWLTAARLSRRRGDLAGAHALLDHAATISARRGFQRLHAWVIAERVRLLTESGQPQDLEPAMREVGARADPVIPTARQGLTTAHEAQALAWVRVAHVRCRTSEAIRVARSWRTLAARSGAMRSLIRWEVLLAKLLVLDGQRRAALRILGRAAAAAAPGRFFASFLDEGPLIETLIRDQADGFAAFGEPARAFVARLMSMSGGSGSRPLLCTNDETRPFSSSSLGPRELEVLALAGKGWRNQDIGARLAMTEATVKWYLHQVYEKLGVNKRALAADKARRFGLID